MQKIQKGKSSSCMMQEVQGPSQQQVVHGGNLWSLQIITDLLVYCAIIPHSPSTLIVWAEKLFKIFFSLIGSPSFTKAFRDKRQFKRRLIPFSALICCCNGSASSSRRKKHVQRQGEVTFKCRCGVVKLTKLARATPSSYYYCLCVILFSSAYFSFG